MGEDELSSIFLHQVYVRMDAGDARVRDDLLVKVQARLERLARKMLRGFPKVRRWEDTSDLLQSALIRLLRALEEVRPASARAFFGLAAEQIRRSLLDLARHYQGPHGQDTHHASVATMKPTAAEGEEVSPASNAPAPDSTSADLDKWCALHEAIEKLPALEREVMGLSYYHGWTQPEIAALLQVNERTVRRYWNAACLKLSELLGGDVPTV